jgi:hypothetical protein
VEAPRAGRRRVETVVSRHHASAVLLRHCAQHSVPQQVSSECVLALLVESSRDLLGPNGINLLEWCPAALHLPALIWSRLQAFNGVYMRNERPVLALFPHASQRTCTRPRNALIRPYARPARFHTTAGNTFKRLPCEHFLRRTCRDISPQDTTIQECWMFCTSGWGASRLRSRRLQSMARIGVGGESIPKR